MSRQPLDTYDVIVAPTGGSARADWIVDVARGFVLLLLWMPLVAGVPHLGALGRPMLSGVVSTLATAALTLHWLRRPAPTARSTVLVGTAVIGCGAAISLLAGADALTGPKPGWLIATWACMYVTSAWPGGRWALLALAWVHALVVLPADPVGVSWAASSPRSPCW